MMFPALTTATQRLRRRWALAVLLGELSRQLLILSLICGVAALLARVLFELPTERAALFFLPLILLPLTSWWRARPRVPSTSTAAAWLDLQSGAQGFVVSSLERPDVAWQTSADAQLGRFQHLPSLRWRAPILRILPGLAFALLALFVPLLHSESAPITAHFERSVEELREKLAELEEVVDLEEEQADEFEQRLERLDEAVREEERESLLEALDALEHDLESEATNVVEELQSAQQDLEQSGEEAFNDPTKARETLADALRGLEEMGLEKLAAEALPEGLDLASLKLPEGLKLSPAELRALDLKLSESMREALAKLSAAGLTKLGELGELDLSGKAQSLASLLEKKHTCDESCKQGGT